MALIMNSKNRTLSVRVTGELDLVTAPEFRENVDQAMENRQIQNLLIDLSDVSFIDSSGLGVLLGRYRKIKTNNGVMVLFGMNQNVKRVMELSGVMSFMLSCDTENDAWKIIEKMSLKEA